MTLKNTMLVALVLLAGCADAKTYDAALTAACQDAEDFDKLGDDCSVGVGLCEQEGTFVCEDEAVVCDAKPGRPQEELCDDRSEGVDDDCDGEVDEIDPGRCCSDSECRQGLFCSLRNLGDDSINQGWCDPESPEDPDEPDPVGMPCEGDDDLAKLKNYCFVGVGQCRRDGAYACLDSEIACEAEPGQPGEEICQSEADEDCDGEVDEAPEGQCCDDADCGDDQRCELTDLTRFSGGRCVDEDAKEECGGTDLMTDDNNCGECGEVCSSDESCVDGRCELDPECGGADLDTDEQNCGTCGEPCASGQLCAGGYCLNPQVLAAGANHVCALQQNGEVRCWGGDAELQAVPAGRFVYLTSSAYAACAIRETDAQAVCWGTHYADALDAPSSPLRAITLAKDGACGIRADNDQLQCWGDWPVGVRPPTSFVQATAVAGGDNYTCALQTNGSPTCWGVKPSVPDDYIAPVPIATFNSVDAGTSDVCAIRTSDQQVECWGLHLYTPPTTPAAQVSTAGTHACLIRADNQRALCWGNAADGQLDAPRDALKTLVAGGGPSDQGGEGAFTCGVRDADDELVCWGSDANWPAAAPAGAMLSL